MKKGHVGHLETEPLGKLALHIYGETEESIAAAKKELADHRSELTKVKMCKEKFIKKMNGQQRAELEERFCRTDVRFTWTTKGLTLEGMEEDVDDVRSALVEMERGYEKQEKAAILQETVEWEYETRTGWTAFDKVVNMNLETARRENQKSCAFKKQDGVIVTFDLMRQIMSTDGIDYKIKRTDKKGATIFPSTWKVTDSDAQVELDSSGQEYKDVEAKFLSTLTKHGDTVHGIVRIQNPTLYTQYQAEKKKAEATIPPGVIVERELWHGTAHASIQKISKGIFNRSLAGKNATVYGLGSYFAVNSTYSAQNHYSVPDSQGFKHMIMAKVITGEFCKANETDKQAPQKADGSGNQFNSTVDDINNPKIFVVHKDASAYPAYVIKFK